MLLIEKISDYFYDRRMCEEVRVREAMEELDEGRRRSQMTEHQAYCRSLGISCSEEDADAYLASRGK
jgi:hypothetical protein